MLSTDDAVPFLCLTGRFYPAVGHLFQNQIQSEKGTYHEKI